MDQSELAEKFNVHPEVINAIVQILKMDTLAYSIDSFAEKIGVHKDTIKLEIREGRLKVFRAGGKRGRILIRKETAEQWMIEQEQAVSC